HPPHRADLHRGRADADDGAGPLPLVRPCRRDGASVADRLQRRGLCAADGAWTVLPAGASGGAGGDLPQHVLDGRGGGDAIRLSPRLSDGQRGLSSGAGLRYAVSVLSDPAADRIYPVFPDPRGRSWLTFRPFIV